VTVPYLLIGNVISVFLAVYVFIIAETKGRIVIITAMAMSFVIPKLWPDQSVDLICSIGRVLCGIGCVIYIKWQAVS
jgi:hypothetical protein